MQGQLKIKGKRGKTFEHIGEGRGESSMEERNEISMY
jgi:hypothetical protein